MTLKIIVLLALFSGVYCKKSYKICVPEQYMKACQEILEVKTKSNTQLECIPVENRLKEGEMFTMTYRRWKHLLRGKCYDMIQKRQADLVPVSPEDMYVAAMIPNQDFVVFQEFRTEKDADVEFKYDAVIVVHKDLNITSLEQLKGLKSCHTKLSSKVGYQIPLTMLKKLPEFPKMNNHSISPKENELKALSTFFKKSCIVGKWSPDLKTNAAWKSKYSQLCALCENPEKCENPNDYSRNDGALRCLAHNGGEVAFTKSIYVRKFFGLQVGTAPASQSQESPDHFAYLCTDGSKRSIRGKACSWAAMPWEGLVGHKDILAKISPLREKIRQLAEAGKVTQPEWFTRVLGMSDNIYVVDNIPIKPIDYLKKANYTDVIERGHGPPPQETVLKQCVTSDVALAKCRAMSVFAFSRDIRPRLDCVLERSEEDCLQSVRDHRTDLVSVDDMKVTAASEKYNLHPVFDEYFGKKTPNYAVAVVKMNSRYKYIEDLRGKRSCHNAYGTFSDIGVSLYYLMDKKNFFSDHCLKNLAEFFSGGLCLPGVDGPENSPKADNVTHLRIQCSLNSYHSPLTCLKHGKGDVAFVSSSELPHLHPDLYELMCLNRKEDGRDTLSNYTSCNIASAPAKTMLSAKYFDDITILYTPLSLAQLLDDKTDLFHIYGDFLRNHTDIFNNNASAPTTEKLDFDQFKAINDGLSTCGVA